MKKQVFYRIAVSVLFLLFGRALASAQSPESLMTVQVPFDFQVGGHSLPAGQYVIKRDSQSPSLLRIHCPEQKIHMVFIAMPLNLPEQQTRASLTFRGHDDKHFLSQVKFSGSDLGYALFESKAEGKLAQATKSNQPMVSSK